MNQNEQDGRGEGAGAGAGKLELLTAKGQKYYISFSVAADCVQLECTSSSSQDSEYYSKLMYYNVHAYT